MIERYHIKLYYVNGDNGFISQNVVVLRGPVNREGQLVVKGAYLREDFAKSEKSPFFVGAAQFGRQFGHYDV
jgi:hypothetical protein